MSEAAQIVDQIQAAPVTPTPNPETPQPDRIASKIDILLKRERAALEAEKAAKLTKTDVESKLSRYNDFEQVKTNPKKALELLGVTYDDLTRAMLSEGEVPPDVKIKELQAQIEELKSGYLKDQDQAKLEKQREQESREQQQIELFKTDINKFIETNPQRYELIKFENSQELVYEVIDEHYNRTLKAEMERLAQLGEDTSQAVGKVLSVNEAADKVELFLEQKYEKSRGLNKVQTLFQTLPKQAQQAIVKEAAKQEQRPTQTQPKTLTNQLSAERASGERKGPITDEERIRRAIAYARSLRPNL